MSLEYSQMMAADPMWYYRDPDGTTVRGPYASTDMIKWFASGYFSADLPVRKANDMEYIPLSTAISILMNMTQSPFVVYTPSPAVSPPVPDYPHVLGQGIPYPPPPGLPPLRSTAYVYAMPQPNEDTSDTSQSPPNYPPAPGSDGCMSESGLPPGLVHTQVGDIGPPYLGHRPPSRAESTNSSATNPAGSYASTGNTFNPKNGIHVNELEKHLEAGKMWYEHSINQMRLIKEQLPFTLDRCVDTAELVPSREETGTQVGQESRNIGTQASAPVIKVSELRKFFENLGITIENDEK